MSRLELPGRDALTGMVVLVGPTASGKSEVAVSMATALDAEIVNADASAMVAGMDVGTAKPSQSDMDRVPHHCVDLWDFRQGASVAEFQDRARGAIADIQSRGRLPLIVGGSALYVRAVADVLDIPPRDDAVRERLNVAAEQLGGAALHRRLSELDPAAAAAIDPRNTRRVVRALEVVELVGSFSAHMPQRTSWRPTLWLGLEIDRPALDRRIDTRTVWMWDHGLIEETARLLEQGFASAPTAAKAIGYAQAIAFLSGESDQATAMQETADLTRRLARRQQRVFRQDERINWIPALPAHEASAAATQRAREWLRIEVRSGT